MIYIRKIYNQDIDANHQMQVVKEPAYSFFNFPYNPSEKNLDDKAFTLYIENLFDENGSQPILAEPIQSRIYQSSATKKGKTTCEARLGSDLRNYLKANVKFEVGDILVFRNKKGKADIDYSKIYVDYISANSPLHQAYNAFLQNENHCVALASEDLDEPSADKLDSPLQQIYYGAPGTGKSHTIGESYPLNDKNTFRTTFHPDTDYASFVGCYKPTMKKKSEEEGADEEISYTFVEQVFTKAYIEAWKRSSDDIPVFLVIDEINRGNCAQIFGDLFQLLDRNSLGFSEYEIKPDSDLEEFISKSKLNVSCVLDKKGNDISELINAGKLLKFPRNLNILATMNTSDQSLYPMDSAFKRRWEWVYVPINYNDASQFHVEVDGKFYKWSDVIRAINKRIKKATSSADKQLGNRFVMADDDNIIASKTFVNKVMFYLWNDVFKDADDDDQIFKNVSYFEDFFEIDDSDDPKFNTLDKNGINIGRVSEFINGLELKPDEDYVSAKQEKTQGNAIETASESPSEEIESAE